MILQAAALEGTSWMAVLLALVVGGAAVFGLTGWQRNRARKRELDSKLAVGDAAAARASENLEKLEGRAAARRARRRARIAEGADEGPAAPPAQGGDQVSKRTREIVADLTGGDKVEK